jgi:hypothetical protein
MPSPLPVGVVVTGSKLCTALKYCLTFPHILVAQDNGGGEKYFVFIFTTIRVGRSLCSSDSLLKQPFSKKPIMREVTF